MSTRPEDGPPPSISVAAGVTIALVASLVQSLGLTIQRKSHLQNERLPSHRRRKDWKRPLWLVGFAIFITSNILGSVFQIGALPIVVLAPLGAVSLLWNAFFARVLLGDLFSKYLILGTFLIAGGAVLIAIFGVVPETTHSLEELLALYRRTSFVVWIALQFLVIIVILTCAHLSESAMERRLQDVYIALPSGADEIESQIDDLDEDRDNSGIEVNGRDLESHRTGKPRPRKVRRWSTPPSYLSLNKTQRGSRNNSGGDPGPEEGEGGMGQAGVVTDSPEESPNLTNPALLAAKPFPRHVSFGIDSSDDEHKAGAKSSYNPRSTTGTSSIRPRLAHDRAEKIRLWLGIAYGSASGTMSGLCLLFAKTGIELLILTIVGGKNQFKRWESWMIVLALLVCALLQLWYLNKSLRLVGPTLICPLAFCFYNLSSIFNGLMYYDQWSQLTGLQDGLMCLGIAILLGGVWIVSIKSSDDLPAATDVSAVLCGDEEAGGAIRLSPSEEHFAEYPSEDDDSYDAADREPCASHAEETFGDLKSRIAHLYQAFLSDQDGPLPRGFSVGIAASSPGFAIRPQSHHHHMRRNTMLASSTPSSTSARAGGSAARRGRSLSGDDVGDLLAAGDLRQQDPRTDVEEAAVEGESPVQRPIFQNRTASAPTHPQASTTGRDRVAGAGAGDPLLSHRHRRKRSLAGEIYVGAPDPFTEEPFDSPASPLSASHGAARLRRSSSHGSAHHKAERERVRGEAEVEEQTPLISPTHSEHRQNSGIMGRLFPAGSKQQRD